MKKIVFIGFGNMASAIAQGAIDSNFIDKENVYISGRDQGKLKLKAHKFGVNPSDNAYIAKSCDIVFLGVKPYGIISLLEQIKSEISEYQIIVSMAAGVTVKAMEEALDGSHIKIIRMLPNTPALVGEGMTALSLGTYATAEDVTYIEAFCQSFGKVDVIEEKLIDAVSAVSGSSPAFVYQFIEALADGAVLKGLYRERAYKYASQAVLGAAKMVLQSGEHPGQLKDKVCSPGGSTIEGIKVLEQQGMRSAVINAVAQTTDKASKLG